MNNCKSSSVHKWLAVFWAIMIIPTLTILSDKIWWIGIISIATQVSTEWGAYEAAKTKEKLNPNGKRRSKQPRRVSVETT